MELKVKAKKKIRKPRVKIDFNIGTRMHKDKTKVIDRKLKYKKEIIK